MEDMPLKSLSRNRVLYDGRLINKIYKGSELIWEADFKPDLNGVRYAGANELKADKYKQIVLEKSNGYEFPVMLTERVEEIEDEKGSISYEESDFIDYFNHDGTIDMSKKVIAGELKEFGDDLFTIYNGKITKITLNRKYSFDWNTLRNWYYYGEGKKILGEDNGSLIGGSINCIASIKNYLYVAQSSGVIFKLTPRMDIETAYYLKPDEPRFLPRAIIGMFETKDGNLFAINGEGKTVVLKPDDLSVVSEGKVALKEKIDNSLGKYVTTKFIDEKPVVVTQDWYFDGEKSVDIPKVVNPYDNKKGLVKAKILDFVNNFFVSEISVEDEKGDDHSFIVIFDKNATVLFKFETNFYFFEEKTKLKEIGDALLISTRGNLIRLDKKTMKMTWKLDINDYYKFEDKVCKLKWLVYRKVNKDRVVVDKAGNPTGDKVDKNGLIYEWANQPTNCAEIEANKYIDFENEISNYPTGFDLSPTSKPEMALIKDFVIDKDGVIYIIGNFDHILRFEQYKKII